MAIDEELFHIAAIGSTAHKIVIIETLFLDVSNDNANIIAVVCRVVVKIISVDLNNSLMQINLYTEKVVKIIVVIQTVVGMSLLNRGSALALIRTSSYLAPRIIMITADPRT